MIQIAAAFLVKYMFVWTSGFGISFALIAWLIWRDLVPGHCSRSEEEEMWEEIDRGFGGQPSMAALLTISAFFFTLMALSAVSYVLIKWLA